MCGVCIFSLCFPCCNPLLCFLSACRCIVAVNLLVRRTPVLPPTLGVVAVAIAVAKALLGVLALLWTSIVRKRVLNFRRKCLHLLPLLPPLTMELLTCKCVIPSFVVRPWEELLLQLLLTRGGSSKGATGGKLAPVDLSLAGRKTSSKSSSSKSSSKTCPYCTVSPGENLCRHAYGVHVPWYMDPTRVCWTCLQSFKQPSMLEAHRAQCAEGSFQRHAATWAPRITTFFCTVA